MTQDITIYESNLVQTLNNPQKIAVIKSIFAKGCTDDEFGVMMELARRYYLDPFSRQIWAIKYGNQPAMIFASRDGLLSIAHRSGFFDGIESAPNFDEKGALISATCTVYRKDISHPFKKVVYLREYASSSNPLWKSKPITMLCKVAEAQALRQAFSVSGLYDDAEINRDEYAPSNKTPQASPQVIDITPRSDDHTQPRHITQPQDKTPIATQETRTEATPQNTQTQPAKNPTNSQACHKCGNAADLEGYELERMTENFKAMFNYELETPICKTCANALWRELMTGKLDDMAQHPKKLEDIEAARAAKKQTATE